MSSNISRRSSAISTPVIGVAAGIAGLLLLLLLIKLFFYRRPAPRIPLPPVQMLAHDRQRVHQEYLQRQSIYPNEDWQHCSSADSAARKYSVDMHAEPYTHSSGLESPSTSSIIRPSDPPYSRSSTSLLSSSREDTSTFTETSDPQQRSRRYSHSTSANRIPRPRSYTSSRRSSVRGAPHRNPVDIILPAPLAVHGVENGSPRRERQSIYDQWVPPLSRSTSRTLQDARADRRGKSDTPPVPPVPNIYTTHGV